MPVIDIHCHAAGLGAGGSGCFLSPTMRRDWRFRVFLRAFGVSPEQVEAEGDRAVFRRLSDGVTRSARVDAAVVLAFDAVVDERGTIDRQRTPLYLPNDFVAQMAREHDGLLFGASVHPRRRDALDRLHAAAEEGVVLVKWLPPVQRMDPADPRNVAFYEKLAELGLPLLVHTGSEHAFPEARQSLGTLDRLRLPLEVGVTVVAAHCGLSSNRRWTRSVRDLAALMAEHPNLYGDVSNLTQVNRFGALPALLKAESIRPRLVYGTDMPLLCTAVVDPCYFCWKLRPGRIRRLRRLSNPWDRDVALKRSLGLPDDALRAAARLLAPENAKRASLTGRITRSGAPSGPRPAPCRPDPSSRPRPLPAPCAA